MVSSWNARRQLGAEGRKKLRTARPELHLRRDTQELPRRNDSDDMMLLKSEQTVIPRRQGSRRAETGYCQDVVVFRITCYRHGVLRLDIDDPGWNGSVGDQEPIRDHLRSRHSDYRSLASGASPRLRPQCLSWSAIVTRFAPRQQEPGALCRAEP